MKALQALDSISQEDLDEVTRMIAQTEATLERLRNQQRMIKMALGLWRAGSHLRGTQRHAQRKKAAADAGPAGAPAVPQLTVTDEYRLSVKKYLMANGPASQTAIAKQLGIPSGSMTAVLKHEWFRHTAKGVELTGKAY